MKILIASLYLPYPDMPHGGGQDLFGLIEALGERHTISVISFADQAQAAHAESLRSYVADLQLVMPSATLGQKLDSAFNALRRGAWQNWGQRADREMRHAIADRARREQADVLLCVWTQMGRYLDAALPDTLRVLDEVDVRFLVEQAAAAGHWWRSIRAALRRRQELAYCHSTDLVLTRSARDLAVLQRQCPDPVGLVLPPVAHASAFADIRPDESEPCRVLFVGAMDRARNQTAVRWLVNEIWPRVHATQPEAALRIVGANPPPNIRALAKMPGVQVTGWVSDLRSEYARARVIVAPMRSEAGALNKVMDGLAAGRPIVATTLANVGIGAPPETIHLADDADAFAHAVVQLLEQKDEWRYAARAGRQFALATFDWPTAVRRFESTLFQLVHQKKAQSKCARVLSLSSSIGTTSKTHWLV
jgi:glycosyltransferase involved in cell wall biosynthesis